MRGNQCNIIHIDMDAFYASVEQRDRPELRGQPVIVGGDPHGRGVVAACSYEARAFGVHSAMPAAEAGRLCPDAVFIRPRFAVYREISARIRDVFRGFTAVIEPLALDEAYLDVTGVERCGGSAWHMAQAMRAIIRSELGLVASAGISCNKFLAKLASDHDKPDGIFRIAPEEGEAFVARLPVGRFHGIGPVTEARMNELGIHTGADLRAWPLLELEAEFGRAAGAFFNMARGIDDRPVRASRERRSLGAERTYDQDVRDVGQMRERLGVLGRGVLDELEEKGLTGSTLSVKVRFADFRTVTRSRTLSCLDRSVLPIVLPELLERALASHRDRVPAVRLLGVSISGLSSSSGETGQARQLSLSL